MSHASEYCKPGEFKPIDLLAVAAAREVNDGDVVFAGTGLPMLAITLAQRNTPLMLYVFMKRVVLTAGLYIRPLRWVMPAAPTKRPKPQVCLRPSMGNYIPARLISVS